MELSQLFHAFPLDAPALMSMFWHALVFEVPRFLLAALAVGASEWMIARRKTRPVPMDLKVSLLLAGHDEGGCLEKAIAALREQTYTNTEIIVIDDGSTDDMAVVGKRLFKLGAIDRFLSTGIRGGKSAAANLGLGFCTGDVVLIADIDTTFDRDAVEKVLQPFVDPEVGAVSGNLAVRNTDASVISRFQAVQYLMSISLGRRVTNMLGTLFIASVAVSEPGATGTK